MADFTVEDYKRAARKALAAGDTASAQELADAGMALQAQSQPAPTAPTQAEAPAQDINGPMQGFGAAFQSGIDQPLENMAETASAVGATGTAETLSKLTSAPENYESASAKFIEGDEDGSFAYSYLPKAAVEQIGQYAGSLLTRMGGAAIGTAVAGPAGGIVGGLTGPAAFQAVQVLGPIANERARNNGRDKPNKEDFMAAAKTAAASGALNALIPGKGGIIKRTAAETVTEGAQSVVEQTGATAGTDVGLQIDPRQALGEAMIGGTSAGGVNTAISVVNKAGEVVLRPKEDLDPETSQAAGDVASLIERIAQENGYNLKDIDPTSTGGSKLALAGARGSLMKEMKAAVESLKEKGQYKALSPEDKAFFDQAIRESSNKVSDKVTKESIDFINDRFGATNEGQMLRNVFYKSNVVTDLFNEGLKGGVSQFTDLFNPLNNVGRGYNPARDVGGLLNIGAVASTGGTSLATQVPLVVGGRAIDAVTGRRSKVNRFVQKNKGKDGLNGTTAPGARNLNAEAAALKDAQNAIKEQEASNRLAASDARREASDARREASDAEKAAKSRVQAEEDLRKFEEGQKSDFFAAEEASRNAEQYRTGEPPKEGSPREIVHSVIKKTYGDQDMTTFELDQEIMRTLEKIEADPSTTAERKRAIDAYRRTVTGGVSIIEGSPLNDITSLLRSKPSDFRSKPKKTKGPKLSAKQEAGKIKNQQELAKLKTAMDNDKSILKEDRKVLEGAFDDLSGPLGKKPTKTLDRISKKTQSTLIKPSLFDKYLEPYITRVREQQEDYSKPVGFNLSA